MSSTAEKEVDIVLPRGLQEASASALLLCELLVGRLLSSPAKQISISVDILLSHVVSNDNGVKDGITLILRSGRLEEFYKQFMALLHHPEFPGQPRLLRCMVANTELTFAVEESATWPNFAWRITRQTSFR